MKTSAVVSLLRVIGVFFIILNLIFLVTPTTVLPQFFVQSPPVDIVDTAQGPYGLYQTGLYHDEWSGYYWIVCVRNRSDKDQEIVVVMKTEIDYSPRRSEPVLLNPHEERAVVVAPEQPTPSTNMERYVDALTRPNFIRVEYAETLLPSGSFVTFLVHLILQVMFFVIGGILLGVAQYISREEKATSHDVK